jgi:hypothetical protein
MVVTSVMTQGDYRDHSEHEVAVKHNLTVVAGIDWTDHEGVAMAYWIEPPNLYLVFVTKSVETGNPLFTSRHAIDVAAMLIEDSGEDLAKLLNDNRYMDTSWDTSEATRMMTCRS